MIDAVGRIVAGRAPVFLLVAGPNGASKSTFSARRLEPLGFPCIDPDAVGLQLFGRHTRDLTEALAATQEATKRVRESFKNQNSIALETVFSDTKGYKLALLEEARAAGFRTILVFIGVDSPDLCIARVMDRVDQGGHDVPDQTIVDRFPRCFENLKRALPLVDLTILIDNTGSYEPSGPAAAGLRHHVFGSIECGKAVELVSPLPYWFTHYGIGDAIRELCEPKVQ